MTHRREVQKIANCRQEGQKGENVTQFQHIFWCVIWFERCLVKTKWYKPKVILIRETLSLWLSLSELYIPWLFDEGACTSQGEVGLKGWLYSGFVEAHISLIRSASSGNHCICPLSFNSLTWPHSEKLADSNVLKLCFPCPVILPIGLHPSWVRHCLH